MANDAARLMRLFRRWAPENLAFRELEARVKVAGREPAHEYTVGMRAERLDRRFVLCSHLGWGTLFGAIAVKNFADLPPLTIGPLNVANSLFVLAILALAVARLIRARTRTYAWIEFRAATSPVTSADVRRTHHAVAHVRNNPEAGWVPAEVLLVSGEEGFEEDAVALADSTQIACYRLFGSEFERVRTSRSGFT